MTQPATYWGWAIKGLGGAVSILNNLLRDGCRPPKGWIDQLKLVRDGLNKIVEQAEKVAE